MTERTITAQGYPLWAAEVPSGSAEQPLMTDAGEVVTEDLVDFIFPHTYRVVAWEHTVAADGSGAVLPILAGGRGDAEQFYQFAEEREEAENLARLRIREQLRAKRAPMGAR
ncbi:hypothetical protein [Mangrovihabitans endophyticus]|uniref:Uncharacterized protein n=1 Tax=Mangrovihabitans endophyticus TaxID=1751298 RepID=A0A8J3FQJ9_9ACTN|nr:hypothetical protein [Mangrovihabitans endophyticus]GGL10024.1 hypothetical protein GCM10012284_50960 [Mangrovihabitans endophyticus]